ncbi:MAG: hypothetical protein AAGC68_12545 [Verrucomicrobiota bacterium]
MRHRLLLLAVLLGSLSWGLAAGKKYQLYLVTIHLEAEETDNPKMVTPVKLGSGHRQYYFSKIPTFTDHDIDWFYPFTADDGVSYGAALRLKDHAATELKAITLVNQGKLLGMRVSDATLQAVLIDRPIDDGYIVVWSGLQQKHLKEMRKRFEHVDDVAPQQVPEFSMPAR